ncbi:MAG: succinylglutamate desuccinylase/aspartoacylase family protein [Alphaproteobacteria bacterium]|nr:succinylglutamate desuccinylase/aspartoacylase family protein [Alphaproteobacteria bacterium]
MSLPIHVVHGRQDGPTLFVSAAVHGDELNGVEIIRRLLKLSRLRRLRGTLIAAPVVNVYGFISGIRYLPDRRDLNRSFPGSAGGSLAAQLANLFMREIVGRSTHGIDLHTGAIHRTNFPQIRADLTNDTLKHMAAAFAAPLMLDASHLDGSLRGAATEREVPTLVYEAGEALRFDEFALRVGLRGVTRVMQALRMFGKADPIESKTRPILARSSYWVRAPAGGVLRSRVPTGSKIETNGVLGTIADPFGYQEETVTAGDGGILIGRTNLPAVNQGDGLFHIARVVDPDRAEQVVEQFRNEVDDDDRLVDADAYDTDD